MAILDHSKEKLKSAPISKVIEALGGSLKRVGREFVTQCIWHDDKNPSLTINDEKGFCFCHVCREGGDVIKFVQQRKGLGFFDAAQLSAEILGIALETDGISQEEQERRREERRRRVEELQKEQAVYRKNWTDERAARVHKIWTDRGLGKEVSKEFEVGYSPEGFFGGRITIPIHNHKGELVGWTGRTTTGQPAKYKNSGESDLFIKKSLIFNEQRAKEAARLAGSLIFVEGHLDVLSLWQQGVRNVVAMQGTGAPEVYVLERLARTVDNFILCFDGDEGGKNAVQHFISAAGPMAQAGKIQINVAQLPRGKDPDEVCMEGGVDAFYGLLSEATPWLDWVIDFWAADLDKTNTAHVTEVERELRLVIDRLQSDALRAYYVDKVALAISRDEKGAKSVAKQWGRRVVEVGELKWSRRSPEQTRMAAEKRMLRIFVHRPMLRKDLSPLLDKVTHPPLIWLIDRLTELRDNCTSDLTPHSVMAVVACSEPHFLQQLRTIIQPNVTIDDSPGVLAHLHDILNEVTLNPHEFNPDQPFE